ncbi:AAA family ATPase [Actinomadura decatromicini]|uniref:AAA family ATPase n=1 Tax=Actinomadura decatromicini TaxID=2604572 RepID=A0A5D3FY19_9ACTN|nr:AAA family ATPase [Actinomadura decatromicini]TYK52610.1 AAA family ATPase [Actinomadura decatromicini]
MAVIFVTGMSGTGKSTVLDGLARRGYRVVDTDVGGWIEEVPRSDGAGTERHWREDWINDLLTEHERTGAPLFIAGTVWNQARFYPRFDQIVLLSAPLDVMLERIATRDTNPFGKTRDQRDQIIKDTAEIEPLLRSSATTEIDTRAPLAETIERMAQMAAPPASTN